MKVVLKVGGFVFPASLDTGIIRSYATVAKKLVKQGHRLVIVTGGGEEARRYINTSRELGASEFACDILGIEVSRLNARLIIAAIGEQAYPEAPTSVTALREAFQTGGIIVVGGMQPAQSTNAVAALSAEAIGADLLVNATSVDGVYTSDPRKDSSAKKLEVIDTEKLMELVLSGRMGAGSYELFDPVAIKIVDRSRIQTRILDGRNPENVERAVEGERIGTLVVAAGGRKN